MRARNLWLRRCCGTLRPSVADGQARPTFTGGCCEALRSRSALARKLLCSSSRSSVFLAFLIELRETGRVDSPRSLSFAWRPQPLSGPHQDDHRAVLAGNTLLEEPSLGVLMIIIGKPKGNLAILGVPHNPCTLPPRRFHGIDNVDKEGKRTQKGQPNKKGTQEHPKDASK